MLLSDRLLKEEGHGAYVLPSTILRLESTKLLRQFMLEKTSPDAIYIRVTKPAFSNDTSLREVIIQFSKRVHSECAVFLVGELTAREKAMSSKEAGQMPSVSSYELKIEDLRQHVDNWFGPIAALSKDKKMASLNHAWSELIYRTKTTLMTDSKSYLKDNGGKLLSSLRIERETLVSTPSTFIVHSNQDAQKEDRWILDHRTNGAIVVQDANSRARTTIPAKCVLPGLRRGANVRCMNIADIHDFVLVESFQNVDAFFPRNVTRAVRDLSKWRTKVQHRLSNLSIYRRYDISSPNTCYVAFYSDVPYAATDILLSVTNLGQEEAKIFALWYNSTFNILQILLERVETRGAYIEVPVFVAEKLRVLDAGNLSPTQRKTLTSVFDEICRIPQQSITRQLIEHHSERMKMDLAIARVLGLEDNETRTYVQLLQTQVGNEIEGLKHMMENE